MIKGILYVLLFTILFISCQKDTPENEPKPSCGFIDFMYYKDSTIYLGELANDYILVTFDTTYSDFEKRKFISSVNDFDQNYPYTLYNGWLVVLKFSKPKTCEEITSIIFKLKKNPIVESARYTMKTNDCYSMIFSRMGNLCVNSYSDYFHVKVFDENKLDDLHKTIAETKTEIVERYQYDYHWYILRVTKNSQGDGLQMANYFYESKRFKYAQPDIQKFPVE